jgi:hypothetical protein
MQSKKNPFLILFLVAFSFVAHADEKPSLDSAAIARRAIDLSTQVQAANQKEIEWLWDRVQTKFSVLGENDQAAFIRALRVQLAAERETLTKAKAALAAAKKGTPDLATSLGKFIGTAERTGILQDAEALVPDSKARNFFYQPKNSLKPKNNEITVVKTLLLHAWALQEKASSVESLPDALDSSKLQLAYPAPVPDVAAADFDKAVLYCAKTNSLLVPNAGFIFGGVFIDGKCRGIDCSAYQSYCTAASKRLSTMVMEYTWRELHDGKKAFDADELKIRDEFYSDWGLKEALEEFEAIDPQKAKLEVGDIVIWRTPAVKSKTGHTVMYLEPGKDESEFIGIEVNRQDDKSLEGFITKPSQLERLNSATYVLRRKQ